ncbi:MAG: alkaline phosphatase PhoX, partial [Pseudomonadota bacterium]
RADPQRILDLPEGFSYTVISHSGDVMDDGLLVPPRADGMATFDAGGGQVALVRNHENHPARPGVFGRQLERLPAIDPARVYDFGEGITPGSGGTTTLIYDPRTDSVLRQHLSLAGTEINCAGGATPWGSWLSCEECFEDPGLRMSRGREVHREERHGYVFEVPWRQDGPVEPKPLRAMGRFEHEAAAVNPMSGVVYMTEDKHESLLYRYIPDVPGKLADGGRLQAMVIVGLKGADARNWDTPDAMPHDRWFNVAWVDLDDPDPSENNLRFDGHDRGAAWFARGEGLAHADGSLFMTATIGGPDRLGQVFEIVLSPGDGSPDETSRPARIRLLAQSHIGSQLANADNLTMSPWGDLVICEDTLAHCGLVGLTRSGETYQIADNPYSSSELAGVCFSPDGETLFVNVQDRGLTLAIRGPWQRA